MSLSKYDFWLEQFQAWQASKLSIKSFCQSLSLNYDQFNYWRRKFLVQSAEGASLTPGFAKVAPVVDSICADGQLVMQLPNGIQLSRLHLGNVDTVVALLRALP